MMPCAQRDRHRSAAVDRKRPAMPATSLSRRQFLRAGAAAGAALVVAPGRAPAFVRSRPQLTHGVQSGDVTADAGIVWARADRPSLMLVEVARTPRFQHAQRFRGPILTPDTDFTGKVLVDDLRPGKQAFYRVTLEDLDRPGLRSEPAVGSFRTAPRSRRDVSFTWSADIAGQGWGINPDIGGYRIFRTMAALEPDFFLCSGDTVYADNPLSPTVTLPDGRIWHNIVTPEKSKVAETLTEFRGQFAYNLIDENLRDFAARVPQVNQWDDHEVHNNWYPHQILADPRYTERDVDVLAARAKQAFFEWLPIAPSQGDEVGRIYRRISHGPLLDVFVLDMRTYKDPNGPDVYADPTLGLLGAAQREWLKSELAASTATWKVIVNEVPIQQYYALPYDRWEGYEAEREKLLNFLQDNVKNVVFLTTDSHANLVNEVRYSTLGGPPRSSGMWEVVTGPVATNTFAKEIDGYLGQKGAGTAIGALFSKPPPPNGMGMRCAALDTYSYAEVTAAARTLTAELKDAKGQPVREATGTACAPLVLAAR
jgi:alkaline phosphatase D